MGKQLPVIEVDNEAAAGFAFIGNEEAVEEAIKAQKIQKLRKSIKGTFNKEVLYATKFSHTKEFSGPALHKKKYGHYCAASFGTKPYREYWKEQGHRSLHGYRNPKTGVWVTGYHYFFLNFKQLEIVDDPYAPVSTKSTSFPRFWAIHWHFFMAIKEAEDNGKHLTLLKPRGTGFSELFSSMGARDYTLQRRKKSFYFAAHKDFLLGEGIVQKVWDNLEYLNQNTERGFKRLRQKKDTDFHRRASEVTRKGDEVWKGGEVFARIIDNPNKARGARGFKIYYEEGGSFPKVDKAWNICRPLVEQGGIATGTMILWGTGGEQGPGIAGLEDIFRHPRAYNCLEFDNCWEEDQGGKMHGFFFPVEACMDRFMDADGNPDFEAGRAFHLMERATIREDKPEKEDAYVAEYCMTPTEALLRLASNHFPIAELQRQRLRVVNNKGIQGFLKYGDIVRDGGTGQFKFQIDPKGRKKSMQEYPHDQAGDLSGNVTMIESPYKDQLGNVPANMYYVLVDPFYKDEAEDKTSLGAAYVYKASNNFSASEGDIIVAWYVGRPRTTDAFHKIVFDLARFYGATIQSEIAGGGKGLHDYARLNKLLHLCELEPSLMFNKSTEVKETSKSYFMNMTGERVTQALTYLKDWLLVERSLTSDATGKTVVVLNLNKIYDVGLLDELIKFSDDGNFDRISAMRLLPFMIKEKHEVEIRRTTKRTSDYWNRSFHSGVTNNEGNSLPMDEMKMAD